MLIVDTYQFSPSLTVNKVILVILENSLRDASANKEDTKIFIKINSKNNNNEDDAILLYPTLSIPVDNNRNAIIQFHFLPHTITKRDDLHQH